MRRRRIHIVGATVVSLVAAVAAVPATADPLAAPDLSELSTGSTAQGRSYEITLVTGDTVHVTITADGTHETRTDLAPRPDGRQVVTTTLVGGGHVYVLPSDAAELVANGQLDRRLFDVQQLIADGYADDAADGLPVIVQYGDQPASWTPSRLRAEASDLPASGPVRVLESIDAVAVSVPKRNAESFWSSLAPTGSHSGATTLAGDVTGVWLDGKVQASLDESVPMIGAPEAWASGYDGAGVKVAVLDTGVDAAHPDLADVVGARQSFVPGVDTADDGHGHGTHVAATVAGSGAAAEESYRGAAPGVELAVGKVLDDSGAGNASWIIDGMEWAAETEAAPIVSMSLGSGAPSDGTDPMSQAVDALTASTGALFVIAAGNEGPGDRTVAAPAAADAALAVAALDKSDQLAGFSSRGPRFGDEALKPEIAAPGVHITAARAAGTALCETGCVQPEDGPVDDSYTSASGTSMAAPHVAGAAALLLHQHPAWTQDQLKAALTSTAVDDGFTVYEQGSGMVDVGAAAAATVLAETATVDFARVAYPQTGPPITRTVTYRNDGDQPMTLTLSTDVDTETGDTAPSGMFTVTPATLDVPAGGTAVATVSLDATMGESGLYSGAVLAEADAVSLRTPIGAHKEPEGFDLTVRTIQRDGAVTGTFGSLIIRRVDVDDGRWTILPGTGSADVRLDKGVYSIAQTAAWSDRRGDVNNAAFLIAPEVELDTDTSVTLDANQALRLEPQVDRRTEILTSTMSDWRIPVGSEVPYGVVTGQLPYQMKAWAMPTPDVTVGRFLFEHNHLMGTPLITAEVRGGGGLPALPLHPRYQHYSVNVPKLDGRTDLAVVDVGSGSADEFAEVDVRDKIALIDVGDKGLAPILGVDFALEELTRAVEAGAAAVFGHGDEGMPLLGAVAMPNGAYPQVPTVALPAEDGEALRARLTEGAVTVRIDSQPTIPDVYSLSYLEQGSIPEQPSRRVGDDELATVRPTFHGDRPLAVVQGWSPRRPSIFQPDSLSASHAALSLVNVPGPLTRTEHVGPVSSTTVWNRSAVAYDLERMFEIGSGHVIDVFLGTTFGAEVFDRPVTRDEDWAQAPTVPGMPLLADDALELLPPENRVPCAACRYTGMLPDGDMLPLFTMTTDAAGHWGELTSYSNDPLIPGSPGVDEWHLYADGVELPQHSLLGEPGIMPYYVLPAEPADYRLTEHFVDGAPRGGYGTRADTTWTFSSQAPDGKEVPEAYDTLGLCAAECGALPLIFLSYDLDLRADNRTPAPGAHAFTVTAYQQPTSSVMPQLDGLRVWSSVDGDEDWREARTRALGDGRYQVLLSHRGVSTGTVSLKVQAWDDAGNRVEQVLHEAYGLVERG